MCHSVESGQCCSLRCMMQRTCTNILSSPDNIQAFLFPLVRNISIKICPRQQKKFSEVITCKGQGKWHRHDMCVFVKSSVKEFKNDLNVAVSINMHWTSRFSYICNLTACTNKYFVCFREYLSTLLREEEWPGVPKLKIKKFQEEKNCKNTMPFIYFFFRKVCMGFCSRWPSLPSGCTRLNLHMFSIIGNTSKCNIWHMWKNKIGMGQLHC